MKMPPYADKLGARIEHTDTGIEIVMSGGEHVRGRPSFLHGGAIAGLLEIAAMAAVYQAVSEEEAGPRIKPITVTIDYRRSGHLVDTRAQGIVTRLGQRIANVDAVAWQEDRAKPIATARMNFLLDRKGS